MQKELYKKLLKTGGVFLAALGVFCAGLSMVQWVNPQQAASLPAVKPPVAAREENGRIPFSESTALPKEESVKSAKTWELTEQNSASPASQEEASDYPIRRLRLKGERISLLKSRVQDQSLSETERSQAEEELLKLLENQELELACEESLRIRGCPQVFVSLKTDSAVVFLGGGLPAGESRESVTALVAAVADLDSNQILVVLPSAFVDGLPEE